MPHELIEPERSLPLEEAALEYGDPELVRVYRQAESQRPPARRVRHPGVSYIEGDRALLWAEAVAKRDNERAVAFRVADRRLRDDLISRLASGELIGWGLFWQPHPRPASCRAPIPKEWWRTLFRGFGRGHVKFGVVGQNLTVVADLRICSKAEDLSAPESRTAQRRAVSRDKAAGRRNWTEDQIREAARVLYNEPADDPPNIVRAESLIRKRLPGASRERIRPVLAAPEFSNLRRGSGDKRNPQH